MWVLNPHHPESDFVFRQLAHGQAEAVALVLQACQREQGPLCQLPAQYFLLAFGAVH